LSKSGYTFSVIIPVYNAESTVGASVDAALAQTLKADEIIVCNDGSTDGTGHVLASYDKHEITIIDQMANAGVSAASNRAARAATSDFLVKLDADDTWHPKRLEAIDRLLAVRPYLDIVTTNAWCSKNGRVIERYYPDRYEFPDDEHSQPVEILRGNFVFGSAAFRRTRFLDIGGFDTERDHQGEYDGWVRMVLSGSRVGLVDEPLAIYNYREGSHSSNWGGLHRSVYSLLKRTLETEDLSPEQILAAQEHMEMRRLRAVAGDALAAVMAREPSARRLCVQAARQPGRPIRSRVKMVASAVSPELVRLAKKYRR
jgi:glycosyltransferase involved in cell wall biosynthesis